jgi:acyl transferase domain-containing protein
VRVCVHASCTRQQHGNLRTAEDASHTLRETHLLRAPLDEHLHKAHAHKARAASHHAYLGHGGMRLLPPEREARERGRDARAAQYKSTRQKEWIQNRESTFAARSCSAELDGANTSSEPPNPNDIVGKPDEL